MRNFMRFLTSADLDLRPLELRIVRHFYCSGKRSRQLGPYVFFSELFVVELRVRTGQTQTDIQTDEQTDEQTDRRTGKTRNVA